MALFPAVRFHRAPGALKIDDLPRIRLTYARTGSAVHSQLCHGILLRTPEALPRAQLFVFKKPETYRWGIENAILRDNNGARAASWLSKLGDPHRLLPRRTARAGWISLPPCPAGSVIHTEGERRHRLRRLRRGRRRRRGQTSTTAAAVTAAASALDIDRKRQN